MQTIIRLFSIATLLAVLTGCATVTETGRKQFLLVSTAEESQLGLTEFQKIKQSTPISKDAALNATVQRVGKRIASVATLPNAQWEFVVFDQPQVVNAFCLPGGKVGIYTGILQITKDETGLATVIGHEVAHATARHGAERMSQMLMTQMGGQLLGTALGQQDEKTKNLFLGVYGATSQVGWVLPHSRSQELEADRIGLLYMARAGYNPTAAIDFWKRFQTFNQQNGKPGWEFLSTHPVDATRITQLQSLLPEAMAEYQKTTGGAPTPTAVSSNQAPR